MSFCSINHSFSRVSWLFFIWQVYIVSISKILVTCFGEISIYCKWVLPLLLLSVSKLCPTVCDLMNCSMPGFPVLYYLPEFAQTHVRWVSDVISPSHPLMLPSPLALNLFQHQDLFQWVSSLHQVARDWNFSFSISPSNEYSGLISFRIDWFVPLLYSDLSGVFSSTTFQKHQLFWLMVG